MIDSACQAKCYTKYFSVEKKFYDLSNIIKDI